ncbi:hypothetical protein DL769_010682 [Monosporascus sp. CRB-8-3]|nr:hypothetical protein DL769_010682 [Monosporascus sp. CRB-8-3]
MLGKPKKTNMTQVKSYRPIALLLCLGKGLERIIAKRLSRTALAGGLLSPRHAGASPKRAATDLTAAVVHEIELALLKYKCAALVTMDVQGAFDSVLRKRLLQRLLQQGWHLQVARWVSSFMSNRNVRVRFEDSVTMPFTPECGLPQGSPASPVLFMLYMAAVPPIQDTIGYGYADDIGICVTGNTPEDCSQAAGEAVSSILQWGRENKVSFDPGKCELMHFSRSKCQDYAPEVRSEGLTIRQVKEPALRWLEVWFDRKLKFVKHVKRRVKTADGIVGHLRNITNTQRGLPANAVRQAVRAVVYPTALYGAEAWYAGAIRMVKGPRGAIKEVSTRQGHLVQRIDRMLSGAMKTVLPAWRTTPTAALFREAALPIARTALDQVRLRFAARLRSVPEDHPLTPCLAGKVSTIGPRYGIRAPIKSRLQHAADLLPECLRPLLVPWRYPEADSPVVAGKKTAAAKAFRLWVQGLPPTHVVAYSDGSKLENGAVGYGYVIYQGPERRASGNGRLGDLSEVFDGEAESARMGLRHALRLAGGHPVHICLDNAGVVAGLTGNPPDSSQAAFLEVHNAAAERQVAIRWVPRAFGSYPRRTAAAPSSTQGTATRLGSYPRRAFHNNKGT